MRVGIVYPVPLFRHGGAFTSDSPTFNSIAAWARGFDEAELVTFVADGGERRGHFAVQLDGLRVLELPCPRSRLEQHLTRMPAILRSLHRILSEHRRRWDAVVLFDLIFPNWIAYDLCRLMRIPVALRMVGRYDLFVRESVQGRGAAALAAAAYASIVRRVAARAAAGGVVVTDGDAGFAAPRVRPSVRFCVESHVDAARVPPENPYASSPRDGPFRALSVSRIHPAKGVHLLVEAVGALGARGAQIELDLVGPDFGERYGNYRAVVHERIRAAAGAGIRYHGRVEDGPEFDRLWEQASVFVVPYTSHADGVPRVLFEAMTRGIPIVATAIGGIPRVIRDGVEGLLVAPGDPGALATAIDRVRADPELRARLSRGSFAAARAYTSDRVAARLSGMLAQALEGSAAWTATASRRVAG